MLTDCNTARHSYLQYLERCDGGDGCPGPALFTAVTRNLYDDLGSKPVATNFNSVTLFPTILHVDSVEVFISTMYPVIAEPPLLSGARNVKVASCSVLDVTSGDAAHPGTSVTWTVVDLEGGPTPDIRARRSRERWSTWKVVRLQRRFVHRRGTHIWCLWRGLWGQWNTLLLACYSFWSTVTICTSQRCSQWLVIHRRTEERSNSASRKCSSRQFLESSQVDQARLHNRRNYIRDYYLSVHLDITVQCRKIKLRQYTALSVVAAVRNISHLLQLLFELALLFQ